MIDRFLSRIADLAERAVVALESLDPSNKPPAPVAQKPERRYRRQAPGSIHPDQCPWCLGFDARTSEQRAAMVAWRRLHPRSQRTACKGWRRCRFVGAVARPKPTRGESEGRWLWEDPELLRQVVEGELGNASEAIVCLARSASGGSIRVAFQPFNERTLKMVGDLLAVHVRPYIPASWKVTMAGTSPRIGGPANGNFGPMGESK